MLFSSTPLTGKSRWTVLVAGAICGFALISNVRAGDAATATITDTSLGGGEFDYSITLKDIGTGDLGTFWYSWVPGEDFMPVSPTNIVAPTGWTDVVTHGGSGDGYAIQFVSSLAPLTPGGADTFTFESTATPAQIAGDSPFYPTTPVDTAFVYSGAPFSDAGSEFQVAAAPEPSSVALVALSGLAFGLVVWTRRRALGRLTHHLWASCSVPERGGVEHENVPQPEDLWDKYYTGAPARRRRCVGRSNLVKRA